MHGSGTEHYTVTWGMSNIETNIMVVGVYDNTQVSMTLPSDFGSMTAPDGTTYSSGDTLQVCYVTALIRCDTNLNVKSR